MAALAAPWEAAAAVLGVAAKAASARTSVSLEARGAVVVKVVRPGARGAEVATAALVVKVVAPAATVALTAAAAPAVEMAAKVASRTPCNGDGNSCTRMELLCTCCCRPRYSKFHYCQPSPMGRCIRSSGMASRGVRMS